ncbi:MAG TPA: NTP transferase domain-containing protein [Dehalococcoidia bacterium]|nr:NTP transferase domain-containing protein [Dehalococcoidia bacterium]
MIDLQVVILAGGLAKRLGGLTGNHPKSLLEIQGKPFLEYQLELLRRADIENVVLCLGHLGEQIERYFGDGNRFGVSIHYSIEDEHLGTAGALKNARDLLDDVFFCMYGDSYLFVDFPEAMRYFKSQNKLALMAVFNNKDLYDKSNTAVEGNLVSRYDKTGGAGDMVYIDYGLHILRKRALDMVPDNQFYSLEELFPRLIALRELLAYEVGERFYEIGSPQGFRDFSNYIKEKG